MCIRDSSSTVDLMTTVPNPQMAAATRRKALYIQRGCALCFTMRAIAQHHSKMCIRDRLKDYVEPYAENDIHHLADAGNEPKLMYLMREGRKWRE